MVFEHSGLKNRLNAKNTDTDETDITLKNVQWLFRERSC